IGKIGSKRVHPILDACGHRDPDAILRIAQDEIHLADRLAVDAVGQHARATVARHQLQAIRAEVGDQEIAILVEGEAVGQRAREIAASLTAGVLEMAGVFLRDDLLLTVWRKLDDAAPRVGAPERSVAFREDAFRPLQIVADISDRSLVDAEVPERVWLHGSHEIGSVYPKSTGTVCDSCGSAAGLYLRGITSSPGR